MSSGEDDRSKEEENKYFFKKLETKVKTKDGETKTDEKVLFLMNTEYIEFLDDEKLKRIKFEEIEKIYFGKQPTPEKARFILSDMSEVALPNWILEDFDGVLEKISDRAGLEKTEGTEFENSWKNKFVQYLGYILGISLMGFAVLALAFGGIIVLGTNPCLFGPFLILGIL